MYDELIVVVSDEVEDIDRVWRTLESRDGGQLLTISDVVLITRDDLGKSAFQVRWQSSDLGHEDKDHGRLVAVFAELIFGGSRVDGHRRLGEAGVDKIFLRQVDASFRPGSSAYLIYIHRDSLIDTHRYHEILEALPGKIYHTTFRPQTEEVLLKQNG